MNKIIFKTALLAICVGGLSACASTVEPVHIEPVEFSDDNSTALNIANQTYLTKPIKYGFKTIKSPLRDFTVEEISASKAAMNNAINGGTAAKVFGAANILTGNLTGVIDVAGGLSTDLASSDHPAAKSHWFVAVDSGEFTSAVEANNEMKSTIISAVLTLLKNDLNIYHKPMSAKHSDTDLYLTGNETFGMANIANGQLPFKGVSNLIEAKEQYLTTTKLSEIVVGGFSFRFMFGEKLLKYKGIDGYDQYLKDLTSLLPKGYFLYIPSFPKEMFWKYEENKPFECANCGELFSMTLTGKVVPSIYTQGKRYDFIKP